MPTDTCWQQMFLRVCLSVCRPVVCQLIPDWRLSNEQPKNSKIPWSGSQAPKRTPSKNKKKYTHKKHGLSTTSGHKNNAVMDVDRQTDRLTDMTVSLSIVPNEICSCEKLQPIFSASESFAEYECTWVQWGPTDYTPLRRRQWSLISSVKRKKCFVVVQEQWSGQMHKTKWQQRESQSIFSDKKLVKMNLSFPWENWKFPNGNPEFWMNRHILLWTFPPLKTG